MRPPHYCLTLSPSVQGTFYPCTLDTSVIVF
nr:MAG TPA: hypothetical protein [Caudoviricetes sp.]